MLDPGMLGTLIIGLESARREAEMDTAPATRRRRAAWIGPRVAVARQLRALAGWLDAGMDVGAVSRA